MNARFFYCLPLLLLAGCSTGSLPVETGGWRGDINLSGSSTLAPLAGEIGKRFEKLHPGVRVNVQTGGSSRGIADAHRGVVEIGMTSRPLHESERDGLKTHVVARDGVGFIVNKANPVGALSTAQLRDIYTGKLSSWKQAGGGNAAVTVIDRAAGRSEVILVADYLGLQAGDVKAGLIAGENQQALKMVAADPAAIAYISVGASEYAASHGGGIRLLPLAGIEASPATVSAGRYPLSRPLIFVTRDNVTPLVAEFIRFARSEAVHDLVKELSYVPAAP